MQEDSMTNQNQSSLSTAFSQIANNKSSFFVDIQQFFMKMKNKQSVYQKQKNNEKFFSQLEIQIQDFIIQTFFRQQKFQKQAQKLQTQYQEKVSIKIEEIYLILKLQNPHRFMLSLYLISVLNIQKQKLATLSSFFYQLLNSLLKNVQSFPFQNQVYLSKRIYDYALYIFSNNKQFFENTQKIRKIIEQERNIKQSEFLQISVSKISKILNSIICFNQKLISIKCIIKLLNIFYQLHFQQRQKTSITQEKQQNQKQNVTLFYLKLLQKIEYKICRKLQKFQPSSFDEEDILCLIKLILLNDDTNIHALKRYMQIANDIFSFQNKGKSSIKLSSLTNQLKLNFLMKKLLNQQNEGYGILCTVIKILTKKENSAEANFFKQKIFILCLNFIRYKFTNHVKLFSCIIQSFSQQMSKTVSIFCLQFLNQETVKFMSVQKVKSLLKVIAQVANQSTKIKDSQKVTKKLFKVKEIIKIFQNASRKYKQEEINLFFNNHPQSTLRIQNMNKVLSFMFVLDLHNQKSAKNCYESFKIIKFKTSNNQQYQLQLLIKSQTYLQTSNEKEGNQLNLQTRNILEIKIFSNKVQIIKEIKQYITYNLQNSLQLFLFVSLIKQPSKKYHLGFSIDGAYFQIQDSKNPQINQIQFGSFQGIIKNLYFFNKELQPQTHKKFIQLKRKISVLLQNINKNAKDDCILYKLNQENQQFILDQKKQKKFFFQSQIKCTHQNVVKIQSLTFLNVLKQLGGIQSVFYIVQKINQISSKQNQVNICIVIQRIFKMLTEMAILDGTDYFLKSIQKSFVYINQFLFLLLKRSQLLLSSSSLLVIQSIFNFIIYFVNQEYRQIKFSNAFTNKKKYVRMFQIQVIFVRDILCNFQLWAECCSQIQLYILRLLEEYVHNQKFTSQFFRLDLHKKLIFSCVFYNFQKELKIQQKILNICKILYDKYLSLPVNQIFNFNQLQNTKKSQKKDLLYALEGCIHRDVNTCMSLIYFLLNSKNTVKSQEILIINLCNYFIQNFVQRQEIFKKVSGDWIYVVNQLHNFLLNQKNQEIKMNLLKIMFSIANFNKVHFQVSEFLQWIIKSIETAIKNQKNFLSCFQCALNIIDMNNQLFKLPINDIVFQVLRNQLKTQKIELFGNISEDFQRFEKLIKKLNEVQPLFSSQYVKFQQELKNSFQHNFCNQQTKIVQSQKQIKRVLFENKLILFTKIYNQGIIQTQNSQWIVTFLNYCFQKQFKHSNQDGQINFQEQLLMKSQHLKSNFKLVQFCSCLSLLRFFQINGFLNVQPKFLLFHLTNAQNECSNMMEGGTIALFLLKQNKKFQEIEFISECLNKNKNWNQKKQDYNGIFFCSLIIFYEVFTYLLNTYMFEQQNSGKSQKPIQAEIRKKQTLMCLNILSKIYKFIDADLMMKSIVTQKDYNSISNEINYEQMITNISIDIQKKNCDQKKIQKQIKNNSQNISKFCKKYLNDIQKNKKTDIFFKDFMNDMIQKIKYIETIQDPQLKIHSIYKFISDKTQKDAKFIGFFIQRLKYTGKIFLEAQKSIFILHHYKYFMKKIKVEKLPEINIQKVSQFQGQPYTTTLIQKFNKNLQIQKKKVSHSEENWTKIEKANEFWLHQDGQLYKNQFFELDEKQIGPFGFYKLNIKPVKDKTQKIIYPRRKKIANEIAVSQYSSQECQLENNIAQVQIQDSFKEEDKKEKYKILQVQSIQNLVNHRNTLLQPQMQAIVNILNTQDTSEFYYCEYITKKGAYAGKLMVKQNVLDFHFIPHQILPIQPQYRLSTGKFHQINQLSQQDDKHIHKMKIKLDKCQLFTRRYILRHTGIQLFQTSQHKSYFFNLFFKNQRDKLIQQIKTKVQDCIINRKEQFQKRKFTQKWQNGTLSNFQYLMLINRYSGRSTNDLAQYPVLPWVIANYSGENGFKQINQSFLSDSNNLRRLDYPPGKLSNQKFKKLKNRLLQLDFCGPQERFLYGTMFSNPTVLYNFFIRLQPFIQLHWQHQGKRIDHADRLFSGIEQQFKSVLTASSDMKQLTPQFYYWPQFLRNRNQIDLGKKQNKEQVNDVILPIWAKTPQQFIFRMRQVLQSHEISQNLHHWIDLTFGYKVKYEAAQQNDNLYHYNCYQKQQDFFDVLQDQKQIRSLQVSISQFGQVPESLFDYPHPQKFLRRDILNMDGFFVVKSKVKQKNTQAFGFQTCRDGLMIWFNKQVQFKRSYLNQNYSADQQTKQFLSKGDYCILINFQKMSWLSLNEGILRVFTKKMMRLQENIGSDTIQCIGNLIFYAKKSQIIVGQLQNNIQNNLMHLSKKGILHGHKNEILYIKANKSLDILLSLDYEGYVMIHEIYSLQFLRGFQLNLQKQIQKKQLRQKQISLDKIIKVCIHQMGYFIFLVNQKNLLVYTFLGQPFIEQDIELSKKRKENDQKQEFTDIQIFSHQKSLLLLSTSKGNIYMIDFIQIKRFNACFPYKTYGRIQNNVISNVKKLIREAKTKQNLSFIDKSIRSFRLQKTVGQRFPLYQIIVQYQQGQILCLYQQKYMGKQLKDNYKLKQLGLFR